jgi:putative oxidoreductase
MPPKTRLHTILLVARVCLGAFFLYVGGEKLFRMDGFIRDVANYQIVGAPWDEVVAFTVAWLEIVAGLLLMLGVVRQGALLVLGGLTLVFMAGIGQAWARGLSISCGCFGASAEPTNYPLHVSLNALILATIAVLLLEARALALVGAGGRGVEPRA